MAMDSEKIIEVVKTLIGPTDPVGDSTIDGYRMNAVKLTTEVVDSLWQDLIHIECRYIEDRLASRKEIASFIRKYTRELLVNSWEKESKAVSLEWVLEERLKVLKVYDTEDDKSNQLGALERMGICFAMLATRKDQGMGRFNEDVCNEAVKMLWPLELERLNHHIQKGHQRRKLLLMAIAALMAALDRNYHIDKE